MKVAPAEAVKHRLYPLYDSPSENIEKYENSELDSSTRLFSIFKSVCNTEMSLFIVSQEYPDHPLLSSAIS